MVEPGRSIVAQAGTALYTVGGAKDIPGVRRYVFVDGGMGDNIRPALYDSKYEAVVANKMGQPRTEVVTIAGKFCESGDILIRDIRLPKLEAGDILAVPAAGAYSIPMASNYNASLRPAIVMVREGQARLIRQAGDLRGFDGGRDSLSAADHDGNHVAVDGTFQGHRPSPAEPGERPASRMPTSSWARRMSASSPWP